MEEVLDRPVTKVIRRDNKSKDKGHELKNKQLVGMDYSTKEGKDKISERAIVCSHS